MPSQNTRAKTLNTDSLPNSPGVYFFYDRHGQPVYIGKSIHIRKRVLSHIYDAKHNTKERKILSATHSIGYTQTPSDLSALLLESQKIKQYSPLYNRKLRKARKTLTWHIEDSQTFYRPILVETQWPPTEDRLAFGLYRSKTHAEKHLIALSDKQSLCKKILGLEKTNRACFGYQLKKCYGACINQETADEHNQRFLSAIQQHQIQVWPYPEGMGIIESDAPDIIHIIDNWQFVGTHHITQGITTEWFEPGPLDYDAYKILAKYIFRTDSSSELVDVSHLYSRQSSESSTKRKPTSSLPRS